MKRILVATDFSEHALAAARLGVALARRYGGTATLLHALDLTLYTVVAPQVWESYNHDRMRASEKDLRRLTEQLSGIAGSADIEIVVQPGESAAAIVEYANEWKADLIAMGTYGAHAGQRFLLGSVAARVARSASCPVLVTRTAHRLAPTDSAFQFPLVAVDYSKFSIPAVRLAATLAGPDSTIELLHIMRWPGGRDDVNLSQALAKARAEELGRLEKFAAHVDVAPIAVTARADIGRAADHVLEYIAKSKTDLVIVGAHGRDDKVSYLGTVADRILRGSTVPVILLPEASLSDAGA